MRTRGVGVGKTVGIDLEETVVFKGYRVETLIR